MTHRFTQQKSSVLALTAAAFALLSLAACDDEVTAPIVNGSAGSAGMGGSNMTGDAGVGGSGMAVDGPTGTLEVLTDDQDKVLTAATGAFRGDSVWFTNFQADQLFSDDPSPVTPFSIRSVPLAGGDVSATEIVLPGDTYYPEGVTADSDGVLYIGSVTTGVISRAAAGATEVTEFVAAGVAERGVVGLTVDAARELLWFCDSNPTIPGAALVGVSLADGTLTVRHNLPTIPPTVEVTSNADAGTTAADAGTAQAAADAGTAQAAADAGAADASAPAAPAVIQPFCNDVIVDSEGRILLTESAGGLIYEIAAADALTPNSATVWLSAPEIAGPPGGFGVNGIDFVGNRLIVANGVLVSIDPSSSNPASTIETITLMDADGETVALCGPDGLAAVPGSNNELIVVENGFCDTGISRIVKVTLDLE